MVNAEILYEDDEKIKILLKETDRAFVNSIRRTLMSDTPKMAIETVSFIKKTEEEDGEGEGRTGQQQKSNNPTQTRWGTIKTDP